MNGAISRARALSATWRAASRAGLAPAAGAAFSALRNSYSRATPLLKRKPSMASVSALTSRWVARVRASAFGSGAPSAGGIVCGWLSNSVHTWLMKRQAPLMPPVVHCTSRSGGESDITNSRAASTP